MGKICTLLRNKDVGSIGIGAMIVFIAMVLVAGIAASVLIQTSTRLESQAMTTGRDTTDEVATGLAIVEIEGYKTSTTLTELAIMVRCRAGSKDIDLAETIIEISNSTVKAFLDYSDTVNDYTGKGSISGALLSDSAKYPDDGTDFGIIVLEDADDSCSSSTVTVINSGDYVCLAVNASLTFPTSSGLVPRDDVWGLILPEMGSPGVISFTCPASFTDKVVELQ